MCHVCVCECVFVCSCVCVSWCVCVCVSGCVVSCHDGCVVSCQLVCVACCAFLQAISALVSVWTTLFGRTILACGRGWEVGLGVGCLVGGWWSPELSSRRHCGDLAGVPRCLGGSRQITVTLGVSDQLLRGWGSVGT